MPNYYVWMLMRAKKDAKNEDIAAEADGVIEEFCKQEWRGMDYPRKSDPNTVVSYATNKDEFKAILEEARLQIEIQLAIVGHVLENEFTKPLNEITVQELFNNVRNEASAGYCPGWVRQWRELHERCFGAVQYNALFIDITEDDDGESRVPPFEDVEKMACDSNDDEDFVLIKGGWHW